MELWFAIGAPVLVAAFLGWYLWAQRRRRTNAAHDPLGDPRDTWDALSSGQDPTASEGAGEDGEAPDTESEAPGEGR